MMTDDYTPIRFEGMPESGLLPEGKSTIEYHYRTDDWKAQCLAWWDSLAGDMWAGQKVGDRLENAIGTALIKYQEKVNTGESDLNSRDVQVIGYRVKRKPVEVPVGAGATNTYMVPYMIEVDYHVKSAVLFTAVVLGFVAITAALGMRDPKAFKAVLKSIADFFTSPIQAAGEAGAKLAIPLAVAGAILLIFLSVK